MGPPPGFGTWRARPTSPRSIDAVGFLRYDFPGKEVGYLRGFRQEHRLAVMAGMDREQRLVCIYDIPADIVCVEVATGLAEYGPEEPGVVRRDRKIIRSPAGMLLHRRRGGAIRPERDDLRARIDHPQR